MTNTKTHRKARRTLRQMVRKLHALGDTESRRLGSKYARIARGLR